MRAIIWTSYGSAEVLQLREIEKPVPKDNELLIKIHASSVTAGDVEMRSLKIPLFLALPMRLYVGVLKPARLRILGQELSGEVEAVGQVVQRFKPGDQIYATTGFRLGGYAEYTCLPEEYDDGVIALKPANLTFEEAAAVPTGGLEALHFLRKANLQPGEKLLINGAGGSIGTFGLQLARYYEAEVTAVDRTEKLDLLRELGARYVIDYTQTDFSTSGQTYDVIFDVIGKSPFSGSLRSLNPGGRYVIANPNMSKMLRSLLVSKRGGRQIIFTPAASTLADLNFLTGLIEAGDIRPVIDRVYPLEQTAEAHRYAETGQKQGNIVIAVAQ